jgi:hypothetical protein
MVALKRSGWLALVAAILPHIRTEPLSILRAGDTVEAQELLPGFSVPVTEFFD